MLHKLYTNVHVVVLLCALCVLMSCEHSCKNLLDPRIGINGIRIYQLEKRIEYLKEGITNYRHRRTVDDVVNDINDRLYHVEDDQCDVHQFTCAHSAKCISELLVCDGHNDCPDGSDEDKESICNDSPIEVGTVYSGYSHWHRCFTSPPHRTKLEITMAIRPKTFSPRLLVKAVFTHLHNRQDMVEQQRFNVKGYYNFAKLNLVTMADETEREVLNKGLISVCHFHHERNRVNCTLVQKASLSVCGHSYLTQEGTRTIYNKAVCHVKQNSGIGNIEGTVKLRQNIDGGETIIDVDLHGFSRGGLHGFHVHTKGDLSDKCLAAGGHYNPLNKLHGAPFHKERHVGDLGNILVDHNKEVKTTITDHHVSLIGERSVVGKAIVIHAGVDDLGQGGVPASQTTGNAGGRLGCCVIEMV